MPYVALVIRKATGCYHNHTGIAYKEEDKWWFAHATPDGVIRLDYYEWLSQEKRGLLFLPMDDTPEARGRLAYALGKPYDYENLCLYKPWFLITGTYLGWEHRGALKFDCYEFVEFVRGNPLYYQALPTI